VAGLVLACLLVAAGAATLPGIAAVSSRVRPPAQVRPGVAHSRHALAAPCSC